MEILTPDPLHSDCRLLVSGKFAIYFLIFFIVTFILGDEIFTPWHISPAQADSSRQTITESIENQTRPEKSSIQKLETEWGGRFRLLGNATWQDDGSILDTLGPEPFYDGSADLRLTNKTCFSPQTSLSIHYEAIYSGGDTRQAIEDLKTVFPNLLDDGLLASGPPSDDRRFFDLTHTIHEDANKVFYHRLDRLFLTWQPDWGVVRIGRQAVTWGSGFLFNPFDLFNPFAPTDIIRDYKFGDDMINVEFTADDIGDFQLLYVARRNPDTDDVEFSQSSLAAKWRFAAGTTEFDVIVAEHFEDEIIGFGSRGYLKDAAWRLDASWTFLQEDDEQEGFLSLVANMDYSWVWGNRNFYGFIEFYFNGLGDENYAEAISDPAILERINRGEIFTLGRKYLSGSIQMELHPLFNIFLTSINNVADPSGFVQPYAVWNVTQNLELTLGGILYYGESETEYGGITIPGTPFRLGRPDTAYLFLTFYF
jgi:hypothetical protein